MTKKYFILILIAATFIAYLSSLGNPFIWDDEQFITQNSIVQQFDIAKIFTTSTTSGAGVQSNYYRPLTTLSFAIDTKIWENNTFGFHLTNLVLHLGAGLFLFGLLGELGLFGEGLLSPAFWISLFFLIDPLQVEAVSYINSRGDSMFAFFLFLSLYLFAKLGRLGKLGWLLAIGTFILSLLSKEIAMAGAGLYVLIWGIGAIRGIRNKKSLWIIGIIGLVTAFYFLLRLGPLNFGNTLNFYGIENEYTRSLAIRLYTFCKVLWVYFGLLVWPYPLHMERSVELVKSFWSPWVLGMLGLLGGLTALGIFQIRKQKPALPFRSLGEGGWILFGLLWFIIMLIPGSGIVPINGILYEHWLYVPIVGFFIAIYGLLKLVSENSDITQKFRNSDNLSLPSVLKKILMSFGILTAILYIVLTIRQNNIWSDPITFYTYTLSFAPNSARLHNNLGISYANAGDVKDAIPQYQKALQLGQNYPQIYNNLGNAQIAAGDYKDAETNLLKAFKLAPGFGVAQLNLVKLYMTTKQWKKAESLAKQDNELLKEIKRIEQSK